MNIEITHIPAMPKLAMEVLLFDPNSDTASSSKLDSIIKPDKGMTASLLRLANSSFFGQSGRVKSLKDAITLLGLKAVKNLVLLIAGGKMFARLKSESFRQVVHENSILTALVALDLCRPLGEGRLKDEAFLYGLMHNIGMSVIALNATTTYEMLLSVYKEKGGSLCEQEQKVFVTDHKEVGEKAFALWKMPQEATQILQSYDFDPSEINNTPAIIRIVSQAVMIVRELTKTPELPQSQERKLAILKSFHKDSKIIDAFNADYYEMIQDHPFYALAMEM